MSYSTTVPTFLYNNVYSTVALLSPAYMLSLLNVSASSYVIMPLFMLFDQTVGRRPLSSLPFSKRDVQSTRRRNESLSMPYVLLFFVFFSLIDIYYFLFFFSSVFLTLFIFWVSFSTTVTQIVGSTVTVTVVDENGVCLIFVL